MQNGHFWVVGGEYTCCDFKNLIKGTERVEGPFENRGEAERRWRDLSESYRPQAQMRFTIAQDHCSTSA